jgi:2-C-methyl-D-erythritol 2,4-cyclodiphosphate synthase
MDFCVGLGQDSHRIRTKNQKLKTKNLKQLVLGGILIDKNIEVVANSDGDVILHALTNALSSACGGPSLSFYADPLYRKGIKNSTKYLEKILEFVGKKGFKVNNVSISVEVEKPKLEKFHEKIQKNLAKLLNIKLDQVGITFTSGEKLTAFGRGEGIQAFCLVSLVKD